MTRLLDKLDEINGRLIRVEAKLPDDAQVRLDRLEREAAGRKHLVTLATTAGFTGLVATIVNWVKGT